MKLTVPKQSESAGRAGHDPSTGGKDNRSRSGIAGKTEAGVPAVNPRSDRRIPMKSSTKDQAEGKFHEMKGKIKEMAGKVGRDPELEAKGTDERMAGKIQKKVGEIEKVVGK
jgi:uncharacterized protein YjbJ (UPF0337 family)